jgi:hypothetical protein
MPAPQNPGHYSENRGHDSCGNPFATRPAASLGIRWEQGWAGRERLMWRRLTAYPVHLLGVAGRRVDLVFGIRAHGNSFDSGSLPVVVTVELEALRRKKV